MALAHMNQVPVAIFSRAAHHPAAINSNYRIVHRRKNRSVGIHSWWNVEIDEGPGRLNIDRDIPIWRRFCTTRPLQTGKIRADLYGLKPVIERPYAKNLLVQPWSGTT